MPKKQKSPIIDYLEHEGAIWYRYEREIRFHFKECSSAMYKLKTSGRVPVGTVRKGVAAAREYARKRVAAELRKQKAAARKEADRLANNTYPLEVLHKGVILRGRIMLSSRTDRWLVVRLEEPFVEERTKNYGWGIGGYASAGIFEPGVDFSKGAIKRSEKMLVEIYDEGQYKRKHADPIDLVGQLNAGRDIFPLPQPWDKDDD